jgi:hypothetical protein
LLSPVRLWLWYDSQNKQRLCPILEQPFLWSHRVNLRFMIAQYSSVIIHPLRCNIILTRQRIITSSVYKLWILYLIRHLAGYIMTIFFYYYLPMQH